MAGIKEIQVLAEMVKRGDVPRIFFTHHDDYGIISINHGREGFTEFPSDEWSIDDLNEMFGNTEEDVIAAVGGSMFGWDTPYAKTIQKFPL